MSDIPPASNPVSCAELHPALKPGPRTTEFWLTVALNVAAILGAVSGILPPKHAAVAMAISNGLYSVSRGLVKLGAPSQGPGDLRGPSLSLLMASCLFFAVALSGCAGGAADRDFRSRVSGAAVKGNAAYDPATGGASGGAEVDFTFRDPARP